jgi:deoxyribonuclease V
MQQRPGYSFRSSRDIVPSARVFPTIRCSSATMAEPISSHPSPLVIVDVDYRESFAIAAAIVANSWEASAAVETRIAKINPIQPYRPGSFFERELPCILQVLQSIQSPYRAIVIDGYVDLDASGRPGLGAHLHARLQKTIPVIGIAKTAFHGSSFAISVLRGKSQKPLYVTARGIKTEDAAILVKRMHGDHRLPTLVKNVETLARISDQPR